MYNIYELNKYAYIINATTSQEEDKQNIINKNIYNYNLKYYYFDLIDSILLINDIDVTYNYIILNINETNNIYRNKTK